MKAILDFETHLPEKHRLILRSLQSPHAIQEYLNGIPYKAEELDRSPLQVMVDGQAHCLDGGIFAALALWRIGFRPLILDLVPEPGSDDDHVLAVYQVDGGWGSLAKSNFTNLRGREPIHRSLRELTLTYFEFYFNLQKEKSLRGYTRPLDLSRFPDHAWMWDEEGIKKISKRLYGLKPVPLLSPESVRRLVNVDERAYQSGIYGTDISWVYGARPGSPSQH
jgi:hypothetical protein